MSKLKNQMIFTQCSYIFTSTYIEFNINKKSHNHKGLTFDSNIIKSETIKSGLFIGRGFEGTPTPPPSTLKISYEVEIYRNEVEKCSQKDMHPILTCQSMDTYYIQIQTFIREIFPTLFSRTLPRQSVICILQIQVRQMK